MTNLDSIFKSRDIANTASTVSCQRADCSLRTRRLHKAAATRPPKEERGKRGLREQEGKGRAKNEGERKRRDTGRREGEKKESENGEERAFDHSWLMNCTHLSLIS